MKFSVHLIADAEQDIEELYTYVAQHDSPEKASKLLDNIEQTILSLASMPMRGHYPPELEQIGVFDYREVFFKPYRIIYVVTKTDIYVHGILDGRRDMQDLLQQRLLR
ncbi:MAG: type II toxin-antitoxin system RelE/ParE family toxin [Thermodesulfovibrionales bacterium]